MMHRYFLRPVAVLVFLFLVSNGDHARCELTDEQSLSADGQFGLTITGTNSRLRPVQYGLISDQNTWHRVWLSHLGVINEKSIQDAIPEVDFSTSQVVAVVERPRADRRAKLRLDEVKQDDGICFVTFGHVEDTSETRRSGLENVFGFFVIPKSDMETVVRRRDSGVAEDTDAQLTEVASFRPAGQNGAEWSEPIQLSSRMLNIGFAHEPGSGHYDGVAGESRDHWNFASTGTTAVDFLRYSDASSSTARLRVSKHDGGWGIDGQYGIFRGYIYHNCQCVDLSVQVLDLPASRYRAIVYAHGDAPDQNAAIELIVGDESHGEKATVNDGTWRFRKSPFIEGVHYVTFDFSVAEGEDVEFISHRDGSGYSMFNAIQIVPILSEPARRFRD